MDVVNGLPLRSAQIAGEASLCTPGGISLFLVLRPVLLLLLFWSECLEQSGNMMFLAISQGAAAAAATVALELCSMTR